MNSVKVRSVLILVFNRPDTTRKVFSRIREVKPQKLYIAADGPRSEKEGEVEKCKEVRNIFNEIDWPCEVHTLFRDKNLGCKQAVSEGITWYFEHEEEGIILEDDCLPEIEFFQFCEEGLDKWRDDSRIAGLGGFVAFKNGAPFLSFHGSVWGWASWKRAWDNFNPHQLLSFEDLKYLATTASLFTVIEKALIAEKLKRSPMNTWDYYWLFSRIVNRQGMILPGVPLTNNVGFMSDSGTHLTGEKPTALARMENLEVDSNSIDQDKTSFKYKDLIIFDFIRTWKRSGGSHLKKLVRYFFKNPFKLCYLIVINIQSIILNNNKINS